MSGGIAGQPRVPVVDGKATAEVTVTDVTMSEHLNLDAAFRSQVQAMAVEVAAATGATPEAVALAADVRMIRSPELFTVTITLTYPC